MANETFTLTDDGNSAALAVSSPANGFASVYAGGTFDGATVQLQDSPDGASWFDVAGVSFTAAGRKDVAVSGSVSWRFVVSDAGASTSISLWVR